MSKYCELGLIIKATFLPGAGHKTLHNYDVRRIKDFLLGHQKGQGYHIT